jgi:hypothetical protein
MLFKLLKLFGLDIAAEIEAAKAGLEQRAERTAARIKSVAGDVAVIATLGAVAAATATMALIVGLVALYRFTAQVYGDYAGLAAVAAILIVMTAAFATVIFLKAQKLSSSAAPDMAGRSHTWGTEVAEQPEAMPTAARQPDHYFVPSRSPAPLAISSIRSRSFCRRSSKFQDWEIPSSMT